MLRVGLTGGIGSGKSTVARLLVEHGAVLVDADAIAREVVAPGTPGLAAIVERFGAEYLGPDGGLDRPRMAATVFGDPDARAALNAIVHPLVRRRSDELVERAPADAIVVQDVPLLVEGGLGMRFALVVVVGVPAEERVRRLVGSRGMTEADARARISAQADDDALRAAADVWLDNAGSPAALAAAVRRLWTARLVPFRDNLLRGEPAPLPTRPVGPDPAWSAVAARLAARVAAVVGDRGRGVEHVGPTSVPGLPAPDVVELQLAVGADADVAAVAEPLRDIGFVPVGPGAYGAADPARPAVLRVFTVDSPGWREGLLRRDWLRADDAARAGAGDADQAEQWARRTGWVPSLR